MQHTLNISDNGRCVIVELDLDAPLKIYYDLSGDFKHLDFDGLEIEESSVLYHLKTNFDGQDRTLNDIINHYIEVAERYGEIFQDSEGYSVPIGTMTHNQLGVA